MLGNIAPDVPDGIREQEVAGRLVEVIGKLLNYEVLFMPWREAGLKLAGVYWHEHAGAVSAITENAVSAYIVRRR